MTVIRINGVLRGAPFALCLLLGSLPLAAQETGSAAADEELGPIVLEGWQRGDEEDYADLEREGITAPPEPPETRREQLRRLFKLYRDAVNDGMFGEADTLAKQIVELTISVHGLDSEETARAITNLGIAQHGAGDYESALLNFTASIEIIERISDRLNEDLINPLKGQAAAQLALGRPVQAAETYQRAIHISHVNYGPHNIEQVEVLEAMAETYLSTGAFQDAVDMQRRIFSLQARNVPKDSMDLLPALRTQARWLHRLQLYDRERYTWRRVINILEDHHGREALSLIAPLTNLGKSYLYFSPQEYNYQQPVSSGTGEIYLKRALRIAEDNPEADWETEAQAILSLADFYILTDKPNRAERMYRDAWELLSGEEDRLSVRDRELQSMAFLFDARPPRFYGIDPSRPMPARPDGFETGKLVYSYTVSSRGRPTDIELVDASPAGIEDMEREVERELRRAVQRPRVVDGETVDTENITYAHDYYYRPSDLPETVTAAGDPTN